MNKAKLKTYAPQARKDFIAAVTARAHRLGLSDNNGQLQITPAEKSGDLVIIAGQSWPAKISRQRDNLIGLMHKHGFAQTLENVAYTWFNRFAALRYMEIHDYLNHGYRVLSSREGGLPEILGHAPELAQSGDLPGLNPQRAIELKLAGDQDGELYRLTLIAQCNALSTAIPFLFEKIDDETELLLPDNLLLTDSVIAKMVEAIPEEDWSQVEIIGWLYQFYISEKKDQVIGKVVKSEDIPAATQLFTPNWIVKYMVQNTLGAQWLATYPQSPLKGQMEYYIEPAEQTDEAKAQLATITPNRLNPEELTFIDPASGSGHILVEAYDLFKAIYLERGYRQRDVAQLILEKNLFGIDIDDRAAQLAGFALLMKARADDRRLFENLPKLNLLALQETKGLDANEFIQALSNYTALTRTTITSLLDTFAHAKTFGSLIQIPPDLNVQLPGIEADLQLAIQSGDLLAQEAALNLLPLVRQARILGMQFDAVVANPPYMASKFHTQRLKKYLETNFIGYEKDLFSAFISRNLSLAKFHGRLGFMSPFVWMFLLRHTTLRLRLIEQETISSLIQLEYSGFEGATVPICCFVLKRGIVNGERGCYIRLADFRGAAQQGPKTLDAIRDRNCGWFFECSQRELEKLPGSPVAYWVTPRFRDVFEAGTGLGELMHACAGLQTGNNSQFLRFWHEVDLGRVGHGITNREAAIRSSKRWFPCNKGGGFRRWSGNREYLVNWEGDGCEIHAFNKVPMDFAGSPVRAKEFYFKPSMSWSDITSGPPSFRAFPAGFIHEAKGMSAFPTGELPVGAALAFCNTPIVTHASRALNPTLSFQVGNFETLPILKSEVQKVTSVVLTAVEKLVAIASEDWDAFERSWDFQCLPLLKTSIESPHTLESSYTSWIRNNRDTIAEMKCLEEENNRLFINAYGLRGELTPEVPIEQITLTVNPPYRYGGKLTEAEQWTRFRQDSMVELISYAIGCMMGRYSLDEPGLIYAHSGNIGFDPARYNTFPADADGIVPITDELWFEDDAANRIREFLLAVWGAETLDENLTWLVESLGQKTNETPEETIRRYLAGSFFKDHMQTYKKRPIYWLFSSGKQGAFQALVYLHRYHEGTLARMRAEYVVPLTGKIQSRIEMLKKDADSAASNAARNKLNKDIEKLNKKHVELLAYDEKLRHYADLRIQLDLDDGVKVNYGKFGDLLAEVKAVTGGAADD